MLFGTGSADADSIGDSSMKVDFKAAQPEIMELGVDQAHPLSTKISKDDVALLDAGPVNDPLIVSVHHLFQVCVGQQAGWNIGPYG